ncbi:hypothetical protein SORBI_3010G061100 [Sorghum bicolor]|uniref:IST1-like protein n=1 Tax=Sorghum bicolor TaxID=4558 RepID=A0A194YHK8_SORBI|nr:hypothetical protein SORBI_3010G061100 [Sorghum bicolor]
MSSLNSLFNRSTFGLRHKMQNMFTSRHFEDQELLRNRRELQLINMRKEMVQYLQTGQESIARIRVEHIIREQNILASYEIVELFCEFVLARVPIVEVQKECPLELREAIASIIFASGRCSDLPELMHLRNLFTTKYGKEFVAGAMELRPDSGVNHTIIKKLSVKAPSGESKLKVLKAIAQEYNIEWDSSNTEAEFNKKYEDLLVPWRSLQVRVCTSPEALDCSHHRMRRCRRMRAGARSPEEGDEADDDAAGGGESDSAQELQTASMDREAGDPY